MFLFKGSGSSVFSKLRNKLCPCLNLEFTSFDGVTSHTCKPQLCSSHLSVHFGILKERIILYCLVNCLCPWIVWSFLVWLCFVLPEEVRVFRSHFDYPLYHSKAARQEKNFSSTFGLSLVSFEKHKCKEKKDILHFSHPFFLYYILTFSILQKIP